jgi:hypothetical protein
LLVTLYVVVPAVPEVGAIVGATLFTGASGRVVIEELNPDVIEVALVS